MADVIEKTPQTSTEALTKEDLRRGVFHVLAGDPSTEKNTPLPTSKGLEYARKTNADLRKLLIPKKPID